MLCYAINECIPLQRFDHDVIGKEIMQGTRGPSSWALVR